MHLPEEGRGLHGDQAHRFQPARPGCFEMKAVFRQLPDIRKDGKLVAPGMDRELIAAVMLGDDCMAGELFPEDLDVTHVIDPLLKLSDKTGGKGIEPDAPVVHLDQEKRWLSGGVGKGVSSIETSKSMVP